jgi:glycosyltransferase involved in cell wall biosynthesis
LRVLQICHSYYPPFLDCARQYAALFEGTPYKVLTVYLTGEPNPEVIAGSASDEVVFLGYKSKDVSGLKLGAIKAIKQIVAKEAFQFCIAHRVKPTYIALLATNLPVVSVHHNYNDYSRWSRRLLVNFYQKRILMLGVSDSVSDDLRGDLKDWSAGRIQTFYNHIDVSTTQAKMTTKSVARVALNLPQSPWIMGNVGRLHHDKDQATLIKAFAKALPKLPPDSLLVILGKGSLEQKLKELSVSLNVETNVIFTGDVPDAKRYFKAFDVFVLSSDREPFGMVLLEAMAAELPIICSDCGGGAEVVRDVGDLFTYGNVDELSQLMLKQHQQNDKKLVQQTTEKLNCVFSDDAAKKQFFELSLIKNMLQ